MTIGSEYIGSGTDRGKGSVRSKGIWVSVHVLVLVLEVANFNAVVGGQKRLGTYRCLKSG